MNVPDQSAAPSCFPTTPWTLLIEVIQRGGDEASFAALGRLFECYKPAIESFFLRRGHNEALAADHTQAFFHSRIVEPWNRRHGLLSVSYFEEDIKKLPLFATKLNRRLRPIALFVWNALPEATQHKLRNYQGGKEETKSLRAALANDLNALIEGASIYDDQRFADVDLSVESRNLLNRKNAGHWVVWLNRSLLGDAFLRHLTKGIGFLYLVEREERQKFRNVLAHALKCFLTDYAREEAAERAGGKVSQASLEQLGEEGHEVGADFDAEFGHDFDYAFALQVIQLAASRSKHSQQIEAHFRGKLTQKQAADELGISEGAFKAAYARFRERLATDMWIEVSKSVGPDEKEIKAEIQYLMSLMDTRP